MADNSPFAVTHTGLPISAGGAHGMERISFPLAVEKTKR